MVTRFRLDRYPCVSPARPVARRKRLSVWEFLEQDALDSATSHEGAGIDKTSKPSDMEAGEDARGHVSEASTQAGLVSNEGNDGCGDAPESCPSHPACFDSSDVAPESPEARRTDLENFSEPERPDDGDALPPPQKVFSAAGADANLQQLSVALPADVPWQEDEQVEDSLPMPTRTSSATAERQSSAVEAETERQVVARFNILGL